MTTDLRLPFLARLAVPISEAPAKDESIVYDDARMLNIFLESGSSVHRGAFPLQVGSTRKTLVNRETTDDG